MPSGVDFELDDEGGAYVRPLVERYQAEFEFDRISDLQDLDRVIMAEYLLFKWNQDLARGKDPAGVRIDEIEYRRRVKEQSAELRQLKKNIGIDRVTRERTRGEGSVPMFIADLRQRAMRFGIMRNEQQAKAIELSHQLMALVLLHDQSTEAERRRFRCEMSDILAWIRTVYLPEFKAIDERFRAGDQSSWIAAM